MFVLTPFFQSLFVTLSMLLSSSILIHDTTIDKAFKVFSFPLTISMYGGAESFRIENNLHPHVEHQKISDSLREGRADNPRIQPRLNDDRKYAHEKKVPRGTHGAGGYHLPLS